jgi:hypothetical protein
MLIDRVVKFFSSLRLTVVLLALGMVLVFIGTIAQVSEGLFAAQNRWFRSFFIFNAQVAGIPIPFFPGGYLLGTLLLVNLTSAHITRFQFSKKKVGLFLIHIGVILLLVGQLATDMLATESHMRLIEGEPKNFSENGRETELVFVSDSAREGQERVVSVPEPLLARKKEITDSELPCMVRVVRYMKNARVARLGEKEQPASNQGIGAGAKVMEMAPATKMDERDLPAAVIELVTQQGTIGSWLVTAQIDDLQEVRLGDRTWRLGLRFTRYYKPFHLELQKFSHDKYRGTEVPKNFSSRVRVIRPVTKEDREVLIYMNNPLRYDGETYYQSSFDRDDPRVSILQVVRNPSWLTPYFACLVVGAGLSVQFLMHLFGFVAKRRTA